MGHTKKIIKKKKKKTFLEICGLKKSYIYTPEVSKYDAIIRAKDSLDDFKH